MTAAKTPEAKQHEIAVGLRTVATIEAAKGALVILVGLGLLALIHHDVQSLAEHLVRHMHLNPARHYPRVFIEAAGRLTDSRLWFLAFSAFAYSTVRFIEAYGLWHMRAWAEWFAIISGSLYVPMEVYGLAHHATITKTLALLVNLAMVAYMVYVRYYSSHHPELQLEG